MAYATQEEKKGQDQVLDLDPQNQATDVSQMTDQVAAAPAVDDQDTAQATEDQTVTQADPQPPQINLASIEDRSTYRVGDEIMIPTEITGQANSAVNINLMATLRGADAAAALVPVQLSDSGVGRHEWKFTPEVEGEYQLVVAAEDSLGNQTRTSLTLFAEKKPEEQEQEKQQDLLDDVAKLEDDPNQKEMTFA